MKNKLKDLRSHYFESIIHTYNYIEDLKKRIGTDLEDDKSLVRFEQELKAYEGFYKQLETILKSDNLIGQTERVIEIYSSNNPMYKLKVYTDFVYELKQLLK